MPDPMMLLSTLMSRMAHDPDQEVNQFGADQTSTSDYLRPPFPSPSPKLVLGSRSLVPVMQEASEMRPPFWQHFLQNQLKPTFVYDRNISSGEAYESSNPQKLWEFNHLPPGYSVFLPRHQAVGIGQHLPSVVNHELAHATSNQWPDTEMGWPTVAQKISGRIPNEEYMADDISGSDGYGTPPDPKAIRQKSNDMGKWLWMNYLRSGSGVGP